MYKKIVVIATLFAVIGVLALGAVNNALAMTGNPSADDQIGEIYAQNVSNTMNGRGRGPGNGGTGTLTILPPATPGALSAAETSALIYVREEEKLAHDVYVTLYTQWGLPVFQNISRSEQTHTDAIKDLLDRYGLPDPAAN
jgi:hypothetical protein